MQMFYSIPVLRNRRVGWFKSDNNTDVSVQGLGFPRDVCFD